MGDGVKNLAMSHLRSGPLGIPVPFEERDAEDAPAIHKVTRLYCRPRRLGSTLTSTSRYGPFLAASILQNAKSRPALPHIEGALTRCQAPPIPSTSWRQRTYMALRNFAEATHRGYASDIRLFLRYLSGQIGVGGTFLRGEGNRLPEAAPIRRLTPQSNVM